MIMTASCLIAAFVPIALALLVFRYRQVPGTNLYVVLALLSALFSFSILMQYIMPEYEAKLFWRNVAKIPIFMFPVVGLILSLIYAGLERWIRHWLVTLMCLVSSMAIVLFFTNDTHQLMRTMMFTESANLIGIQRTNLNSVFLAYALLLHLFGAAFLLKASTVESGRRRVQLLLLSTAMLLPIISLCMNMIYPEVSTGAAGVILFSQFPSCLLLFWALYRHQVLHIVPFARNKLIEMMKEGIIVLDSEQRIMDYNPAASSILARAEGIEPGNWTALPLPKLLPSAAAWLEAHESRSEMYVELPFGNGEDDPNQAWLAITVTPLISGQGIYYGSLSVISDITGTKKLEQDLRRRASTDGLTGIYNRAGFMERAQRQLSLCAEEGETFSLLLLDLDFFKRINDEHGHQCGDQALKGFVEAVQKVVVHRAMFGRVGGEEFAIALPGSDVTQAKEIAEQIRNSVLDSSMKLEDGQELQLTVSIGGASQSSYVKEDSFQKLYAEADQALYRAKRGGRNKVSF